MELDDLKYQLKNKLATDHTGLSQPDIAELLTRRTVSITDKLKRSLWIEIICGFAIIAGFGYVGFTSDYISMRIYFSAFAVLCVAFVVLLFYLLRRISRLSATTLPVKSNLQTIVNIIEEFTRRYFQFTMALIPVCFFFSLYLAMSEPKPMPQAEKVAKSIFDASWKVFTFLTVYTLGLCIGIYYFTKWYLRKLYGKFVAKLKECIAELGEE